MKRVLIAILTTGTLAMVANAQTNKPAVTNATQAAPTRSVPTNASVASAEAPVDKEKVSYAIGMNIGNNFKRQLIDVNVDTMAKAIKDVLAGHTLTMTEAEAQQTIGAMQGQLRMKQEAEMKVAAGKNKKEGEAFLAENAKKPGVKTTASGLQYKVISEGKGEKVKMSDTVIAQYRGRLINGTEFDSSYKGGQPAEFSVTGVIKGWTEALQMMKPGSKYELYIPSDLAYGERAASREIGPNSTLIFEIELVGIKEPPKPFTNETTQAVSGEIIKVPSKAELDKGAKIEVIRTNQIPAPKK
ncbi:MAG: FKBP-type peptidyl-prolyl cis-trans isomerase [Verrucomicrobiota bacterium]